MEGKWTTDQLRWKIMSCKIEQLKQYVKEMRKWKKLLKASSKLRKRIRCFISEHKGTRRKKKMQHHLHQFGQLVEMKTIDLWDHYEHLVSLWWFHILELTSVIVPIEEVKTSVRDPADVSSESDSAMTSRTVSQIVVVVAHKTTYLSGWWVCDDHNGDTGPWISLPNNGNYTDYYKWMEGKKTIQEPDLEHRNPASTTSAALC